jgi:Protein of unknown function (DUF3043)
VRLLRRRRESLVEDDRGVEAADGSLAGTDAVDPRRVPGKGRPTPKRREAQKRRTGPVAPPPRTRREAYRRMREQNAVRRAEYRDGLRSGDDKYLPARDQGPERRLVRDLVDSRRNAGGLFLLVAVVVFAGYIIPNPRVRAFTISLWMTVFLFMIIDSIYLGFRIRRLVRERFPDTTLRVGRLVWYGITRATMIRRWRMPAPQVDIGNKV